MNRTSDSTVKSIVVTSMFGHGGVVTYWKDLIETLDGRANWLIFVNHVSGVALDPFDRDNVKVNVGLNWNNPLSSSRNLLKQVVDFRPRNLILNGTLACVRVLPAIIILRIFFPWLKIKCVFHNGAIYQHKFKDSVNRIVLSGIGGLCHENIFVSQFVAKYWLCRGRVLSRPFAAKPRDNYFLTRPPTVGFLGRISHEKDPELYLRVIKRVSDAMPIVVEVAGLGPLKDVLQKANPWVIWRGWVDPLIWFGGIDLLITTSRTEGWPISICEALEAGVPVVGVDVGGVGEVLSGVSRRWLKSSRDEGEIAAMILDFFRNYPDNSRDYFNELTRSQTTLAGWGVRIIE